MKDYYIVVLHGWGQSNDFWQDFLSNFENTKIKALDLPGFGTQPIIDNEWGVPEYAEWVKANILETGKENIFLVGHSFGGRIASLVASENPKWLKSLVLYSAPCIYRPSIEIRLKIKVAKILKNLGYRSNFKNAEMLEADRNGLGKVFRNAVRFDQTQYLSKIKVPTLLVWGEKDLVVPVSIAEEMNSLIPNSKLIVLSNLGHNAHLENPNLFYGTIKSFMESI